MTGPVTATTIGGPLHPATTIGGTLHQASITSGGRLWRRNPDGTWATWETSATDGHQFWCDRPGQTPPPGATIVT
jgi:hypothetical protein